jgi:hypothetical protein
MGNKNKKKMGKKNKKKTKKKEKEKDCSTFHCGLAQ